MTTSIKDLKPGDDFTGKIQEREITIDGDIISSSFITKNVEYGTLEKWEQKRDQLKQDIAYRTSTLANVEALITQAEAKQVVEK